MAGRISIPPLSEQAKVTVLPARGLSGVLDTLDRCLIVAERDGTIVLANSRAKAWMEYERQAGVTNLFTDVLRTESRQVFAQVEKGEDKIDVPLKSGETKLSARIRWMPETDWVVLQFDSKSDGPEAVGEATQLTVQELLQEREITYRNLLAAYLKLQEVNRQKTVFLASAAHELKTPLAVIKGYYDLLLAGSLGRLTDKQRDILEE